MREALSKESLIAEFADHRALMPSEEFDIGNDMAVSISDGRGSVLMKVDGQ